MTKDMTQGSPVRLILGFALPMLLGMLFQQFYNLVDTMIVGKTLGIHALAGVGATGCLSFMIIGFCMGVSGGFAIPVAQQFGAKNYVRLRKYVFNSYLCSIVFSLILTVASVVMCRKILILLNTPESIIEYAYQYIVIIFIGIPAVFLYNLVSGIIRALGDSKTPVVFLVFSAILNIALDFILILGFKMGVSGAAVATIVSQLVSGVISLLYMLRKYEILKGDREERVPDAAYIRKLCVIGVPMGLQYSITAIGSVVLQVAVNGLGAVCVAGMTAAEKIFYIAGSPFDALGSTMATYCGQNVGAGRLDRIRKGEKSAIFLGLIYSAIALVFLYFFADQIALLFVGSDEAEVIRLTYEFSVISAAFYFALTFVNVVRFSIQGMGFSMFATLAGVFEMLARVAAAFFFVPNLGFLGACLSSPLAWLAADLFLIPAFFYCLKRLTQKQGGIKNASD